MLLIPLIRRKSRRLPQRGEMRVRSRGRPTGESLEVRNLLSATSWPGLLNPTVDAEPNETLDAAQNTGAVGNSHAVEIVGAIGAGADAATDVDWYRFTLEQSGNVQFAALPNADGVNSSVVLTLYGDQITGYDPTLPLGHHLLGRSEGSSHGAAALIESSLAAGTYFVAVSGAGNRFFHPFLADSGNPGIGGEYGMRIARHDGALGTTAELTPVAGSESAAGNDTPATSNDLGNLSNLVRLQVLGVIGDDPFYSLDSENPFAMNAAADVDLFHFSITGDGRFAFVAEAFAGRIGSTLDPALTLFRVNGGVLQQIATNNNTLNPAQATNGSLPLGSDPVLFVGLTAGNYFLAVSSSGNDADSGLENLFDPQFAHSGLNGGSVGEYVLDLLVSPDNDDPKIVGQVFNLPGCADVELFDGQVGNLPQAPTHFSLQFSEPVNVQQLVYTAYTQVNSSTISSVFLQDANGQRYFPRLESYDSATGIARFLMLDGLPNGALELHVSGAEGLTDLAGHPIVGNDASGDHVLRFTVSGPARGSDGDVTTWLNQPANDSAAQPQDLGVLFPHELQAGVHFVRDAASAAASANDDGDFFRFELLQNQNYFFSLTNLGNSAAPTIELLDINGQVVPMNTGDGSNLLGPLDRGSYTLHIGPWSAATSHDVAYRLDIALGGVSENPTPLTSGAAPAVGIRLAGQGPALIGLPIQFTAVTPPSTTPAGLNDNLVALPLGLSANSTLAGASTPNDNRIVRLFGFGDRDRLFALIDSILPRTSAEPWSVTKAELSDAELADLLKQNRTADDSEETESEETPSVDAETSNSVSEGNDEAGPSATSDATREPSNTQPLSQRSAVPSRSVRAKRFQEHPTHEQPPSAFASPLAIALAASLASTLREQSRREKERSLMSTHIDFCG